MKRQNTVLSSSSYRENGNASTENLRAKSVGCMSGIFHLLYNYNNRRRKSLTCGKKPEKNIVVSSSTKLPSQNPNKLSPIASQEQNGEKRNESDDVEHQKQHQQRRFSCEVPVRSPTIPPEIRRSNSVNSPQNFRPATPPPPPHSLVARLMGLSSAPAAIPPESTAEKRRKLLGALEKCDQDLKALKKIIDAVRSAELETKERPSEEQPSPVSVLDELARSPILTRCARRQSNDLRLQQQKKKPGEEEICVNPISLFDRIIKANLAESIPTTMKRPDHDGETAFPCTLRMTISRGMRESVEQVCKDIAWGERREVGKIGLALQDHICRDLIEETVKELGSHCRSYMRELPPFEVCKRRLNF